MSKCPVNDVRAHLEDVRETFLSDVDLSLVDKVNDCLEVLDVEVLQYHDGMLAGVHSKQFLWNKENEKAANTYEKQN